MWQATLIASLLLAAADGDAVEAPRPEMSLAVDAAAQFAAAYNREDVDRVLACCRLPWHFDGTFTFETADELRKHFREVFRGFRLKPVFSRTVVSARRYAEVRPRLRSDLHRGMFDDVLQRDDFVIGIRSGEDAERTVYLLVRVEGDSADVVGFAHE